MHVSTIDEKKTKKEHNLFETAFSLAKQKDGETFKILDYLNGVPVKREKDDSPDIVFQCSKGKRKAHKKIVGIEHFRVDQISKPTKHKRVSISAESSNHISNIFEKGHSEQTQEENVSEDTKAQLLDQISVLVRENLYKTYDGLIDDLFYNVDKHIRRIGEYQDSLYKIAQDGSIELAMLIEMHAHFPPIFLNSGNHISQGGAGKLIFFKEIADIIKKLFCNGVDYVIILFDGSGFDQFTDVFAIHHGNIEKQLKRQNQLIYTFAGPRNLGKNVFNESGVNWKKNAAGDYEIITEYRNVDEKEALNSIYSALRIAYYSQKNGRPFATTRDVQCLLDAVAPYITGFKEHNGSITPLFIPETDFSVVSSSFSNSLKKYS